MPLIALCVPDLSLGGAERVTVTLANEFVEAGLEVDLVAARFHGEFVGLLDERIGRMEVGGGRVLMSVFPLHRYLKRRRPEVVLSSHKHMNIAVILASRLRLPGKGRAGARPRIVLAEHSLLDQELVTADMAKDRWAARATRWFYPLADALVAVSSTGAAGIGRVTGLPPARVRVINNPIVQRNTPGAVPPSLPWPDGSSPPLVLAVGRLEAVKDLPTLLRAFAAARRQRPLGLVVMGDGTERNRLQQLVVSLGLSDDVYFTGFVRDPGPYLEAASVLLSTSRIESFGNVLVEAMAAGTPVVAADGAGAAREVLADGEFGRLVPVGDVAGFAQAILSTLDEDPDPERLMARAHEFSPETIIPLYLDLLLPPES